MAVVALNNAEVAGRLSFANTVASMGAWGAEIAHDVNRETGAIQRKVYLLQQYYKDFSQDEVKGILSEIEGYSESLVLPPLPKQAPKPGEVIETKNAARLDSVVASYIDSMQSSHPDVILMYELHCADLRAAIHEHWLHRLLRHLVLNAIKATEGRPTRRVLVRTSIESGFVKVEIEDSGKGVRSEILPRLFAQPIRHEDDDRDGQGLLIVRFLTERHGGKSGILWTQPDQGSCFFFTLPIIRTEFAQ
jgi:signal transduction histidine kinase